ncbi:MAG TPA: class I SAM-dependent methyltransferase [Elusimicrobia bacterium]|nr:class I SAM-dependent methyltransferase [Elusimicrobiota bacterium]HBT60277.1 class I SAM-dependent methyltransferase [Elusimicrobiota bacterium]
MSTAFKPDFLQRYISEAPLPLAIERYQECQIYERHELRHPILDIGCGEGLFAFVLGNELIDVGIDPNPRELVRARAYGAYRELICCPGDAIPRASASFNTILSNSVLEHIPDLEPVLREAHRLLAPGGRFFATVPTHLFDHFSVLYQLLTALRLKRAAESYRGFFNRFWRHYHAYTPEIWAQLFARCGFRVVSTQQYCPKAIGLLEDALAPLSLPSLLVKKACNRWFLFPGLRRSLTAPLLAAILRPFLEIRDQENAGGIIFICLEKS